MDNLIKKSLKKDEEENKLSEREIDTMHTNIFGTQMKIPSPTKEQDIEVKVAKERDISNDKYFWKRK